MLELGYDNRRFPTAENILGFSAVAGQVACVSSVTDPGDALRYIILSFSLIITTKFSATVWVRSAILNDFLNGRLRC